jgi:hypothetical protein
LLDQLGILLQRIISLKTCYGARRVCESAPLSKRPPGSSPSRPANYGTQNALEMFPSVSGPQCQPFCWASYSPWSQDTSTRKFGRGNRRSRASILLLFCGWLPSGPNPAANHATHSPPDASGSAPKSISVAPDWMGAVNQQNLNILMELMNMFRKSLTRIVLSEHHLNMFNIGLRS